MLKKNIRFVKGTKKIETSVPNQTVTIVYDGRKTTYADYESAFKKIGYSVKKVKRGLTMPFYGKKRLNVW